MLHAYACIFLDTDVTNGTERCAWKRRESWGLCDVLNIITDVKREDGSRAKEHPAVCTLHVPEFIVGVPHDANTLRALIGHDNFNISCLQQIYNQPRRSCEVGKVTGSNPPVPLGQ